MVVEEVAVETFEEFVNAHERRLRQALISSLGGELGRDATAEALEYGWQHWERVQAMENPVGYLYKVGRSRGRREQTRNRKTLFDAVDPARIPDVEPKLPAALSRLSERQRLVVVLVHGYGWTPTEVAGVLSLSRSSIRNHLERGMATLRKVIGGDV